MNENALTELQLLSELRAMAHKAQIASEQLQVKLNTLQHLVTLLEEHYTERMK